MVLFAAAAMLLAVGCSGSPSSSEGKASERPAAAVDNSSTRACTKDIMTALALKWRQDVIIERRLDQKDEATLGTFLETNAEMNRPRYHIFFEYYTAGMTSLAQEVSIEGRDPEQAIMEQLGVASPQVEADCAALG
ncbi:hypothetical protein AB0478_46370 [Streptomyces sp. NPDC051917]|uniref:hypothetical protein n=1 Tax=Streptomyces sp. NPDC051917 TaxID=3154754 RepID=UPI003453CCD3